MESKFTVTSSFITAQTTPLTTAGQTALPLGLHDAGPTQPPDKAIELRAATAVVTTESKFTVTSSFITAQTTPLTTAGQTALPLGLHDAGPTQPPDKAIELRAATAVVSEDLCGKDITEEECYKLHNFQGLLNALLNIPIDEYIVLEPAIMRKLEESYKTCLSLYSNDPEATTIIKIKHLLNRAIYDWQINHDREKTTQQLLSLHTYAGRSICLYNYLESWIAMKIFKDFLHGTAVTEAHRSYFLTLLNQRVLIKDSVRLEPEYLPMMDLVSLQSLYYLEALPGFSGGANFENGFKTIFASTQARNFFFFSPISFSTLDYMRFNPDDLTCKLEDQKKKLPDSVPGSVMQSLIMFLFQSNDKVFDQWLASQSNFDHITYSEVKDITFDFYELIIDIQQKANPHTTAIAKKVLLFQLDNYEKTCRSQTDRFLPMVIFFRAEIMLSERTSTPRLIFARVARLYEKIAKSHPNHFTSAFAYYLQAGILRKAAEVANQYACFWEGTNDMLAEYWKDVSAREYLSAALSRVDKKTPTTKVPEDLDAVLQQWADESPQEPETARKKGRQKRKTRPRGKKSPAQTVQRQDRDNEASTTATAENDTIRLCQPMIKALPNAANNPDGLPGQYQIKSTQGAIRPFEKLLSRHWNPIIKKTLGLIRMARADADREREQQIYQKVLNNPRLRACIGIERIWEEYAWTELHQFDDCFRTQVMPTSLRADAEQWIKDAREFFILPSLAYCLGLDQIHLHIKPEAVQEGALRLVAQPEVAQPSVNQEIRFRLRCLFSSMGHTYSLSAMACPDQAGQLMQSARKWYGFKTIDPLYVRKNRATQESNS